MHNLLLRLILLIAFTPFFVPVPAAATTQSCVGSISPAIFHINGINTTQKQAQDNAVALAESTTSRSISNDVYLAYNWSYSQITPEWIGGIIDALDATIQGLLSAVQGGLKYSFSLVTKAFLFWDTTGIQDSADGKLQNVVDGMVSAIMSFTDIKVGNTAQIIADINNQTSSNTSLLLVPHSQGNFYANAIYNDLSSTRQVKIVGVATPAPFTAGGGDYVNSRSDRVVTTIVLTARPWNVDIPSTDFLGHSFSDVYLDPTLAVGRQAVLDKIETALSQLAPVTATPLDITLSWYDSSPLTLWVGDEGVLRSAIGISGTATYTVCNPKNFTFYFTWASSLGGWPTTATLSAGTKSATVYLSSGNDLNIWGDDIFRRISGSVFVDQYGAVAGVQ